MYVTTNSSLVWKRAADENLQSARMFAKAAAILLVMLLGTGAYAYSTNARYDDLCTTIQLKSKAAAPSEKTMGQSIATAYCS